MRRLSYTEQCNHGTCTRIFTGRSRCTAGITQARQSFASRQSDRTSGSMCAHREVSGHCTHTCVLYVLIVVQLYTTCSVQLHGSGRAATSHGRAATYSVVQLHVAGVVRGRHRRPWPAYGGRGRRRGRRRTSPHVQRTTAQRCTLCTVVYVLTTCVQLKPTQRGM